MARRICLVAPYKDLSEVARSCGEMLGCGFEVETANLEDAVARLPALEARGYRVLISRGRTAQLLRRNSTLPVIDIRINSYDVLNALRDLVGTPRRVAFVGHASVMRDCKKIADLLGIASWAILFDDDAPDYEVLQEAVRKRLERDPIDVMIGDTIPQSRFAHLCDEFRLVSSGPEGVQEAVERATALVDALERERVTRDHLSTVLDMFEKAVFSLDHAGRVTHANRAAATMFQKSRTEMMGMPIEAIDPALVIAQGAIADGIWEVGQVVETRHGRMLCYLYPIDGGTGPRSMVFALETVDRLYTIEQKVRSQERLDSRFVARQRLEDYVTYDARVKAQLGFARRYAETDATVLIVGESGTGKELLAQGVHHASPRANGAFVAVNCGALPPTLLESELFGYVEGAFTGASRKGKKGLFELAHRGTLFLDEVSELDVSLQARLLRVIQERQLMRLGSEHQIPVDVRIVAATNQDLEEMVELGTFRQDLFYRLNVLKLETLPLRLRPKDIVPSALLLLRKHARAHGTAVVDLDADLRQVLMDYDWPGNFRQLGNIMERIAVTAQEPTARLANVEFAMRDLRRPARRRKPAGGDHEFITGSMDEIRLRVVARVLEEENNSKTRAARRLGVDRTTLNRWLKEMSGRPGEGGRA
ncbi:sigma 54-interacting transcriptional regulator [Rhodoplanes sp. TEM]|uniref:Sigma 54-interacting transcriptional regulator n=1 Tax=Rhodoplanes tepidamans TaxID=200616 RepID=A0ABT5JGE3_RHOTP|nr:MULTISPECIES: sigma 54-interacting transcriptional regulator [Rhodoplanes]MDC7788647.1 sigma 54-interacting transcriptional regulator [Rhodoplanes tepidamans]MDC7982440.1 sigma 54-interacting transcriptional regulator [Rhodoplanes sp. TEM]MDQ0354988.1 transcriptional regulator with PAS, ATPase and Fis domain [Rhodoplanes tepidamans]